MRNHERRATLKQNDPKSMLTHDQRHTTAVRFGLMNSGTHVEIRPKMTIRSKNTPHRAYIQGEGMKLIADYVEEAKEKSGVKSDRAFSLHIGGSEGLVSKWINEGKHPEDYYCIRIAEILRINPLEIIAAANWEREKSQDKKDWWENFRRAQTKQAGAVLPHFTALLLTTTASCII